VFSCDLDLPGGIERQSCSFRWQSEYFILDVMESALIDLTNLFHTQHSLRRMCAGGLGLLCLSVCGSSLPADEKPEVKPGVDEKSEAKDASQKDTSQAEKKSRPEAMPEDRAAALQFAADNHPELARLLEQLKKSRPSEFARATKELNQQIQLLERFREKNPTKYHSQLESWKKESQIRVLMARWSHNNDPAIENQVRELLMLRHEARVVQLQADKDRLSEQQRKLAEQLASLEGPADAQIDKEWEQLSRKAGTQKGNSKKKNDAPVSATGDGAAATEKK